MDSERCFLGELLQLAVSLFHSTEFRCEPGCRGVEGDSSRLERGQCEGRQIMWC